MLTQEQMDFFHREGYLVIQLLVSADEIAFMREAYDRIFSQQAGRDAGDQFDLAGADEEGVVAGLPQILSPSKYAPELLDAPFRGKALEIAQDLFGPAAHYGGDHAILKPAGHGAPTPWHQDEAYWSEEFDHEALSVWIPLQKATVENGCLHFLPGSHRLAVLPHHCIDNDPRIHGLEVDQIDTTGAVACPIPAGGATLHHCRTLHYAGPNTTDQPRRAYIMGFYGEGRKLETPRDHTWNRQKQTARQQRADRRPLS